MPLAFQLRQAGFEPEALSTQAAVAAVQGDGGFTITKSAMTLTAKAPGIDRAKFDHLAKAAETGRPVSKPLNAKIKLEATLNEPAQ